MRHNVNYMRANANCAHVIGVVAREKGVAARHNKGAAGSDALPRLKPGGPVHWIRTRSQIKNLAHDLGVTGHIYYEAPTKGFTYTQNLLAHTAGASALRGQVRIAGTGPLGHVDRGDILQVTLTDSNWRSRLAGLCGQLQARHLHAVPADQLIRGGS